ESLQVRDRPAVELVVVGEPAVEPGEVAAGHGALPPVGGRPPDRLALGRPHPAWTSVPPSIRYAPPVMKLDAGEASRSTSPFSSSGSAMRPSGIVFDHIRSSSGVGLSVTPPPIRVPLNGPGQIAFTRTPCGASSSAACRTMFRTAALLAA